MDTSPSTVTIGVSDRDAWLPPTDPRLPEPGDASGRGLLIVQALATEWGVTPRRAGGPGKTVWFRLAAS